MGMTTRIWMLFIHVRVPLLSLFTGLFLPRLMGFVLAVYYLIFLKMQDPSGWIAKFSLGTAIVLSRTDEYHYIKISSHNEFVTAYLRSPKRDGEREKERGRNI